MGLPRLLGLVLFGLALLSLPWTVLWLAIATVEPVTLWAAERTVFGRAWVAVRGGGAADVRMAAWLMGGVSLLGTVVLAAAGRAAWTRQRGQGAGPAGPHAGER